MYGDWGAYTASRAAGKVCFALSKPTSQQNNPANGDTASNAVYMFVSTRPDEKVNNEISLLVTGYAFKANTERTTTIAAVASRVSTENDGAWVKNAAEEARLIDTMRKSADAVVKAQTSKGTATMHTFSLKGLSQALDRASQECR